MTKEEFWFSAQKRVTAFVNPDEHKVQCTIKYLRALVFEAFKEGKKTGIDEERYSHAISKLFGRKQTP